MDRCSDFGLDPKDFPSLDAGGFTRTSDPTRLYNCIAWSLNDNSRWYQPAIGLYMQYYWPAGVPFDRTVATHQKLFSQEGGYQVCIDGAHEAGIEKIAIFAVNNLVTHAARQLEDGSWTSKIGQNIDISHTLDGVAGPFYGAVACYMSRERAPNLVP